jgi:hypothetical protein
MTHPDDYATNVAAGVHDDYLPDWLNDFAIAEKLRVPVPELPGLPLRYIRQARIMIAAEGIAQRTRT